MKEVPFLKDDVFMIIGAVIIATTSLLSFGSQIVLHNKMSKTALIVSEAIVSKSEKLNEILAEFENN